MLKGTRFPPLAACTSRAGGVFRAVIIPPTIQSLTDLRCASQIDAPVRSADAVLRAVAVSHTWGSARLTGDLFSATRQRDVLRALAAHIFRLIGGDAWASAELFVSSGPGRAQRPPESHLEASRGNRHRRGVRRRSAALTAVTYDERVQRVASLATRLHLLAPPPRPGPPSNGAVIRPGKPPGERDPMWLSELALRLASNPALVEEWAGEGLRAGTTRLLEIPTLARAARFLVIATDRHLRSRAAPGEFYASWGWA